MGMLVPSIVCGLLLLDGWVPEPRAGGGCAARCQALSAGSSEPQKIAQPRARLQMSNVKMAADDPTQLFDLLERLGQGSYGSVFKARDRRDGKTVAVKVIPVENDLTDLMKEIAILERCCSAYIVQYKGSFRRENEIWIVMEFCCAGSLADIMHICKLTLNEEQIAAVCKQIVAGLEYLHSQRHIHRDIKCGNILLDADGSAKLADFGVSVQLTNTVSKRKTVIGTPYWMAPEVLKETQYDFKADIWSLGITAMEMALGAPPHSNVHPMRAIFLIPTKPPPTLPIPENWSPEFNDFLATCLAKDPEKRPSAAQLAAHPFVKGAPGSGRAILQDFVHENQHDIDEFRETEGAKGTNTATTMASSMSSMVDTTISGTIVSQPTMIYSGGTTQVWESTMVSNGTAVVRRSPAEKSPPAYMRQFDDHTMISAERMMDDLDISNVFPEDDFMVNPSATADELRASLVALDKAHQRERDALEKFYQSRREKIQALLDKRK
ncbi:non-specific serine/threonine protein kinase [Plasmodiophora brassicae]|uniref:non-specific serine/threonine protein kinase n=1 Tax=Plasmodiophora brassicae TaxID=37360 RepID=A0A0G4IXA3_PLABS|nr:hypothetical protein PBRA_007694 [Plasmodiophora brassicae]SPQ99591.1 unnamed protein product [Plasmodiophora brassicae]